MRGDFSAAPIPFLDVYLPIHREFFLDSNELIMQGDVLYSWAKHLWPINRSITGPGVCETLAYLSDLLPGLRVHDVPSGSKAFDWIVPDEWTIRDAYIANEAGHIKIMNSILQ